MISLLEPKIMWQRLQTTDETLDQKILFYFFAGLVVAGLFLTGLNCSNLSSNDLNLKLERSVSELVEEDIPKMREYLSTHARIIFHQDMKTCLDVFVTIKNLITIASSLISSVLSGKESQSACYTTGIGDIRKMVIMC